MQAILLKNSTDISGTWYRIPDLGLLVSFYTPNGLNLQYDPVKSTNLFYDEVNLDQLLETENYLGVSLYTQVYRDGRIYTDPYGEIDVIKLRHVKYLATGDGYNRVPIQVEWKSNNDIVNIRNNNVFTVVNRSDLSFNLDNIGTTTLTFSLTNVTNPPLAGVPQGIFETNGGILIDVSKNVSTTTPEETQQSTTDESTPPTNTPTVIRTVIAAKITVIILSVIPKKQITTAVDVVIDPAETPRQRLDVNYPFVVNVYPIEVDISIPLITSANQFLSSIIEQYIDEERELKTLLNLGEDRQSVILASRFGNGAGSIQVKLLQPIPDDVSINTPAFFSREIAQTLIDKFRVRFSPEIDNTPYLRPKNSYVTADVELGKSLKNVTLNLLQLKTGSVGELDSYSNISFEDQIFRRWYSYDFNSAELNIDFTDYSNFVFYGSAMMRLAAFREKLKSLEIIDATRQQFITGSITGSTNLIGRLYLQEESAKLAKQKEDIIRGFDRYEQFLYFTPTGSNTPYTASAYYADNGYEYNSIAYWPKSGSVLWNVTSSIAENWYITQSAIAQRFDDFNENNIVNTIPTHIRDDENSAAYITFVTMVGHFFDLIKPYADQMKYIYDRSIDPDIGLSKDLVNEIAESFGFRLPTIYSVYDLSNTILGTENERPRRDYTVETYKRLLHNLPFFAKAKGTRTALNSLLGTFGITQQLINVKELGAPTSSYYVFDEFSTGLDFDQNISNYILLPILTSNRSPRSLQFSFTVAQNQDTTILTGDNKWALHAKIHPTISTLGRLELTSGSSQTVILSSSYQEIFGDELLNVSIRTYDSGSYASLFVGQVYGEDVLFTSSMIETFGANKFVPLWDSTDYIYLGGQGSLVINNFDGTIDEVRLWGTNLSDEVTVNTMFDPGSNAGDTYEDPTNYLYIQHSFNILDTGSLPLLPNESPYKNISNIFPDLLYTTTENTTFNDFSRYNRTVRQQVPTTGATTYLTSKVKVKDTPIFNLDSINSDGVKTLSRTKSIVRPEQKKYQVGRNKVIISTSPTQIINQNIIRNLGLENINTVLGAPTDLYSTFDKTLNSLKNYYNQYYYVNVNFNRYIRMLSEINSVLNQILEYFIPSKATVLKGVTIEPNILERVKISPIKNLRVYGGNTRKTIKARGSLSGSVPDYSATFNLTQTIKPITSLTTRGSNVTVTHRQENWYRTTQISQSIKPPRPIFIDLQPHTLKSKYEVYGVKQENWYRTAQISQSIKPKRQTNIEIDYSHPFASYNTYGTQHENWYRTTQISESVKLPRRVAIEKIELNVGGKYETYGTQHENWYRSVLVSSGSKPKQPTTIHKPISNVLGSYQTYGVQHENWYYRELISQSVKLERPVRITDSTLIPFVTYVTYNIRHENWYKTALISQSIIPRHPSSIDTDIVETNKVPYNQVGRGTWGAEPFNRIYTRRLLDYEIDKIEPEIGRVLYTPALYDIPPSADFRDIGVTTYFNNENGIYLFPETVRIPTYREPVDINTATTWSYGGRYNLYDVVYQSVDTSYDTLGSLTGSAKAGNGRFYVFTTRAMYTTASAGGNNYYGSVPSYIPPSLDKTNWDLLRFTPIEQRKPKRIVFDTFTITDPALNNYRVTTLDLSRIIDITDRYVDSVDLSGVGGNSYIVGNIAIQNIAALFALQVNNANIRIRLYRTATQRDADISRSSEVRPVGSAGVLLDVIIPERNTVKLINPIVSLVAGENPPSGLLFYTINNLSDQTTSTINLTLFYFAVQIEPRIPLGYLRKHYRFFRDNTTGTKRRNYEGCKNTIDTTIDGLPPVQVFLSEGTDLTVSQTLTNTEIKTGGGGTLDVT